ncbi:MAG: extracellular solute-binding protein [Hyphomicrobiales bacterium]|nr:extracellular solute-binding protein [Hyphomicrobiales bacterium]
MHGEPRYGADMTHFPHADPQAPKGGRVVMGVLGTFDSLNPLTFRGSSADGIRGHVFESLLARSPDEPFTLYAHIARSIDVDPQRSRAIFSLRREARFSDGQAITAADVVFSLELLREKGWPFMRTYYRNVERIAAEGEHVVRFDFKPGADGKFDRELPLLIGLMPILPRHAVDPATFDATTLVPPVGSGPYVVDRVEAGRLLVLRRNPAWWAAGLPIMRGRYNFDEIRYDYFRDQTALLEAFKSGAIDIVSEDDANRWSTGYDFPAVRDGRVKRLEIEPRTPAPFSALAFNTRREVFADPRVRRALARVYDAELVNRNIHGGLARRTHSLFERSALSSFAVPADARERALLAPFPDAVAPAILDGSARMPTSPGNGENRANQMAALRELSAAGFRLDGQRLVDGAGRQLAFEILIQTRSQERLVLPFSRALATIGVAATVRQVDSAQYEARLKDGQYDMIQATWASSLSPGNEQLNRWASSSAEGAGTRNYAGVRSPAADAMIAAMLAAGSAEDFNSAVRALDRVVRSGDYVIPLFHLPRLWIAHWAHISPPAVTHLTNAGFELDTWYATRPQ